MWRLFNPIKWFWVTIVLAVVLGTGINLLFADIKPEIYGFLLIYWRELVIFGLFLVILTFWSYLSWQKKSSRLLSIVQKSNVFANQYRHAMIELVKTIWINGILKRSIYQDNFITLDYLERQDLIHRPMDVLVQRPGASNKPLLSGVEIIDVYDDIGRTLLILGDPGSGKTTLLLQLLQGLLSRSEVDNTQPIPVVFPLSTWGNQRLPLAEWLVEELQKRYNVSPKLAQLWIDEDCILPLLDGLDEVDKAQRAGCIESINIYRQDHGLLPMVICSRVSDYEMLNNRLEVQGSILIKSLSRSQLDLYLTRGGVRLSPIRKLLHDDEALWELLDTPLMLNIFVLAYADQTNSTLQIQGSIEDRRQAVFARYIQQMFRQRQTEMRYTSEQTIRGLSWLASQMMRNSQTVFYLEELQPDWLAYWFHVKYQVLFISILGTLVMSPLILLIALHHGWFYGISLLFLWSVYIWFLRIIQPRIYNSKLAINTRSFFKKYKRYKFRKKATPPEKLQWSWYKMKYSLFRHIICWPVFLTILYVVILPFENINEDWRIALVGTFIIGLAPGLLFGLLGGLRNETLTSRKVPNEGIRSIVRNSLYKGILYGFVMGLPLGMMVNSLTGTIIGLIGGLIGCSTGTLYLCNYYKARLILFINHIFPWNCIDFLDFASERVLLRKVGGGYMFIHRYILEYFVTLDTVNDMD